MEWVLEIRHAGLTAFFEILTGLGDAGFLIAFLSLGYWLIRPDVFRRATLLLLFAGLVNGTLKELFQIPRPQLEPLVEAGGWSFPSGHAQSAGALWSWLAWEARRIESRSSRGRAFWMPLALVLAVGISFSRVYLGVHTPWDVSAGVVLGLVTSALLWQLHARASWPWIDWDVHTLALGASAWVMAWWGALPGSDANAAPAGALLGFWVASLYERRYLAFTPPASTSRRLLAAVVGLALVFGLRVLLKTVLASGPLPPDWAYFLRYAIVGVTIGFVIPYGLVKAGWAGRGRLPA